MKSSNIKLAFSAVAAATLLAACGGGSSDPVLVANADTSLPTNAAVAGALAGTSFAFPSGVAALGTTGATTLAFTGTAASPGFSVASGGNTATGTAAFGSCIFVVSNSNFLPGHPLANGQTVTVNPCSTNINTTGAVANGVATSRSVALLLGTAASAGATVLVGVNTSGQLILSGAVVSNIALTPISG
jgi:hypothetical protein